MLNVLSLRPQPISLPRSPILPPCVCVCCFWLHGRFWSDPPIFSHWVSVAGYEVVSSISWGSCPMSPCNTPSHLWTLRCSSLCCRDRPTRLRNTGFKYYLHITFTCIVFNCWAIIEFQPILERVSLLNKCERERTNIVLKLSCVQMETSLHQHKDFILFNQTVVKIILLSIIASKYNEI